MCLVNTCAVCCVSGVPQVSRDDREGWWVQSHGVQEPELQGRLLLGLSGALGATWVILVRRSVCLMFYAHAHACTVTHAHACIFTHTHIRMHFHTCMHMCRLSCTLTHTHLHVYTRTHLISMVIFSQVHKICNITNGCFVDGKVLGEIFYRRLAG